MPFLFAVTLFLSAWLLFLVQPMVGKMLLPLLGGTPAVWNTCMVFFQALLLLGYLYAHLTTSRPGLRRQALLHLPVLLLPLLALPIAVRGTPPPGSEYPALWLLGTLAVAVGLPFFALSTTAPLLQKWFSATGHRSAGDPYFLYAASNAGSLLALLAYPFAVELLLPLDRQSVLWAWGYGGFVVLVGACAVGAGKDLTPPFPKKEAGETDVSNFRGDVGAPPDFRTLNTPPSFPGKGRPGGVRWASLRWVLLAFVPSSLLLGVTQYLSTDLAAVPLLWVVPLALYLLTYIIAFSRTVCLPLALLGRVLAVCVLALAVVMLVGATEPLFVVVPLHLATFFVAALLAHGLLARDRPPPERLTGFYLWLSVGGVLGGLFNALLAPLLFCRLGLVEYPLVLVLACLLRPADEEATRPRRWDLLGPLLVGLASASALFAVLELDADASWFRDLSESTGLPATMLRGALLFGIPAVIVYTFVDRPLRFALGIGGLLLAGALDPGALGKTIYLGRNFLGVVRVTLDPEGHFHRMVHGNTIHGEQRIDWRPKTVASFATPLAANDPFALAAMLHGGEGVWVDPVEPLTYYHRNGPAGHLFRHLVDSWKGPKAIGVVGLGTGSLAFYARPDEHWTFFELDPAVERVARDPRFFTYLRDCKARSLRVVLGDARLRLAEVPDRSFRLLVLDAFSSDAIPVHLLTAEALHLYERKLADGGVLLFHVSNRNLDLPPILARLAETSDPPLVARLDDDATVPPDQQREGKFPSVWVVVARRKQDLGPLGRSIHWQPIPVPPGTPRWTDGFSNLFEAIKRDEE